MVTAISTTESSNIQIPALPNAKTFCAMAAVLVLAASTTGTASVPMQTFATSQNTFFSTDTANRNSYNNGNISLWLEGDSVMSVDKAQSLARLLEIEQLQDNWNGNGANCFSESILSFARKIVMNLLINQRDIFQHVPITSRKPVMPDSKGVPGFFAFWGSSRILMNPGAS